MNYQLDFYSQYRQFYICDRSSTKATDSEYFWTDEALEDRMALEEGIIGVGTECYGPVKGEVKIVAFPSEITSADSYDHIVEGSLELKSGILQVLDCPNSSVELELQLKPGFYRVRVSSSNLFTVEGDEGDDFYSIEIWPQGLSGRNVLKNTIDDKFHITLDPTTTVPFNAWLNPIRHNLRGRLIH